MDSEAMELNGDANRSESGEISENPKERRQQSDVSQRLKLEQLDRL